MLIGLRSLASSFYSRPILLLTLTTLFWSGNAVAGRLVIGEVSPFAVVTLRWLIVSSVLIMMCRRQVIAEWPIIKKHLLILTVMAFFGFTAFNSLFYYAAHTTTALNIGIIQGSMPVFVLVGALAFLGARTSMLQLLGVIITLAGVVLIAMQGDFNRLLTLQVNPGDGLLVIACLFYSAYTLALRDRPPLPGIVFFTVLAIVAAVTSLPLFIMEVATGAIQTPTPHGWLIVAYIAFFPSFIAQLFFMRGVELIGPGRAGVFLNLVPIFSSILAVLILSEPFHLYHALALVLVLGGIWLSERYKSVR